MRKRFIIMFLFIFLFLILVGYEREYIKYSYKDLELKEEPHEVVTQGEVFREAMLKEINKRRQNHNREPLERNEYLDVSATAKVREMVISGEFSHNWEGFEDTFANVKDTDYYLNRKNGITLGENLACGYITVDEIIGAWMLSTGHRENLLRDRFKDMGTATKIMIPKDDGIKCLAVVLHLGG